MNKSNQQRLARDNSLPDHVEIIEVGPRDGFQGLRDFISTENKVRIIKSLIAAGINRIEIASFVNPQAVPQMRDANDVVGQIGNNKCQIITMVPNLKGAKNAIDAGTSMLNLVVSASETHNLSNVRMSIRESLNGFISITSLARQNGIPVRASVSTAFGCPFEGYVPLTNLSKICERLISLGCIELNLCDTTGMANPLQVAKVTKYFLQNFNGISIVMHFHNTRGLGSANVLAAIQNGIVSIETSLGGLGGCPFAPGATGNVCTEDTVHMLHEMGISTGANLRKLINAVREAEDLLGFQFPGQVIRAGQSYELHPFRRE